MKSFLYLLFMLAAVCTIQAQDLHVFYDAFTDSLSYQVKGQAIDQPTVRKGARIILHIDNYNDYLYEVEVVTEEENYQLPSSNISSLFTGGGAGIGQLKNLLGGGQGTLSEMFKNGGTDEASPFGYVGASEDDEAFGSSGYEEEEAYRFFAAAVEEIRDIEGEIEDINTALQFAITQAERTSFMKDEVLRLKTNTSLAPNTVRNLMVEYLERILGLDQGRELNLEYLLELAKEGPGYEKLLAKYQLEIQRLDVKAKEAQGLAQTLNDLEFTAIHLNNINNTLSALNEKTATLHKNADELERLIPTIASQSMATLADIRYLYEEVKDHRFSKQVVINPEADITTLKISLAPIDSLRTRVRARNFTPIKVKSYGGLRVNASVGISFSSLFNKPQNYLVRDGILFGDDLDAFSPVATSFVHFYGESKKQTSLAGTLGLGLGLGGESGVGLQNYFLGPSLVIGKGQRIVLTTGLTGTKVDRLALGLEVGDPYSESIVPLKSVYELGFFFGISFNVLGN